MNVKKLSRLRRSKKTRSIIRKQRQVRLSVHRTGKHIYAQIISDDGTRILAAASTLGKEMSSTISYGGNVVAASRVGKMIAEKAVKLGIKQVAFDRSGFKYHGRIKALADSARKAGLDF